MTKQLKVAKILDEYSIIVNGGSNDGLNEGDILEIYLPGDSVIDPETNEDLGILDIIKARIKIHTIYPKMCLCVNLKEYNPISNITNALYGSSPARLNIDPSQMSLAIDDKEKEIRVGDLVRKSIN